MKDQVGKHTLPECHVLFTFNGPSNHLGAAAYAGFATNHSKTSTTVQGRALTKMDDARQPLRSVFIYEP